MEREEQRTFANWCLQQNLPFVWHSTAHRSKASIGCPDFIVQIASSTLWLEFKRPGAKLSPEQADFGGRLLNHAALYFIVETAREAMALTQRHNYRNADATT